MHSGVFDSRELAFFREGDRLADEREEFSDLDAPGRRRAARTLTDWPPVRDPRAARAAAAPARPATERLLTWLRAHRLPAAVAATVLAVGLAARALTPAAEPTPHPAAWPATPVPLVAAPADP